MAKHHPNHDPFKEMKFKSPFISPNLACEIEQPSPPSLEPKLGPFGYPNVVLNSGLHSTDVFLENKNLCATDILLGTTCFHEDHNHLLILLSKLFKRMVVDAFVYHKYCKSRSCIVALTLQLEQKCSILCGEVGNYTTIDSCKMKFP